MAGSAQERQLTTMLAHVAVQGCTDCMVNPVFAHNFSRAAVLDIYLEMGLLAGASCFFQGSHSSLADAVTAWREVAHSSPCEVGAALRNCSSHTSSLRNELAQMRDRSSLSLPVF